MILYRLKQITKNIQGFSFIEILLIVLIIGLLLVLLISLPRSINLIGRSHYTSVANSVALQKIQDYRASGYGSLANSSGPVAFSDSRLSGFSGIASTYEIKDCALCTNGEHTKEVIVRITWKDGSTTKEVKLDTFISEGGLK